MRTTAGKMWLFRNLVAVLLIAIASASTISPPTSPPVTTTPSPPTATPSPSSTSETEEGHVIASASIADVETPAVIVEVDDDWEDVEGDDGDDVGDDEDVFPEEEEEEEDAEDDGVDVTEQVPFEDDLTDYEVEESSYDGYDDDSLVEDDSYEHPEGLTQEGFEANVPHPLHDDRDIIIDKDNLVPVLRTVVLAYTHKERPSYSELLKAAGVSAFKTSLKYIGKEKLASNLLSAAKRLTNIFDDDERDNATLKVLGELAEEYLANHRFKLVLPESLLLHREEMQEFLERQETIVESRDFSTSEWDISMARADPGVTTLLTIGPMTWMALIGGLVSIPYFLSDSPSPARVDNSARNPSPFLQPPRLPFYNVQHHRREEQEHAHPLQHLDPEQAEYQQSYAEWYNNWYLRYKQYYDENYPDLRQAHIQNQQQLQQQLAPQPPQQQPQPSQQQPVLAFRQQPPRGVQQLPRAQPAAQRLQRPHAPPRPQRPAIDFMRPPPPPGSEGGPVHVRPAQPRPVNPHLNHVPLQAPKQPAPQPRPGPGPNSARHAVSAEDTSGGVNTFGTFQDEGKKGDTHFKVFRGIDSGRPATLTTVQPREPSPQPVFVPTTEKNLQTESGFKPIIRADSPNPTPTRAPATVPNAKPVGVTPGFRPPKQETVLAKNAPSTAGHAISSGFQPIASAPEAAPPKKAPEGGVRKVSAVTSKVFSRLSTTTPSPPVTTPQPAIFFRTATQKSVRVVTSSSVVLPSLSSSQGSSVLSVDLPELKRPQRHQESQAAVQDVNDKAPQPQPLVSAPVSEPARQQHTSVVVSSSLPTDPGFVRTNIPTEVRIVDHQNPAEAFTTQKPTATTVSVYALDPFYGSRLSRIDVIFHQLNMAEEGCREQVVCNIYKNPKAFTPFSDFLSRQLTVKLEELQRPKVSDERILRFFRYLKAAKEGQDGSDCQAKYPECLVDTTTLSHQPIMKAFEKVSILRNAAG